MVLAVLVGIVLGVLGPVIGFIIVAVRAQGRARSLGMLGFGLAGLIGVITQISSRLLPTMMLQLHLPIEAVSFVWAVVVAVLGVIPMIVLAIAVGGQKQPLQPR